MPRTGTFERGTDASAVPDESLSKDIRDAVQRVLESPEFVVPDRARRFLSYIVEEALCGRAGRIKAYSIATDVLGRDPSFDASTDPVVRIEAGRVRRALEHYYLTDGARDPIVVTIPRGSYVPTFTWRDDSPGAGSTVPRLLGRPQRALWLVLPLLLVTILAAVLIAYQAIREQDSASGLLSGQPASPAIPRLLVKPFENLSDEAGSAIIATGLTNEVIGQIAKFKEVEVIAGLPEGTASTHDIPRYELYGGVRVEGDKIRLSTRLVDRADKSVLWAESYDQALKVSDLLRTEAEIASKVATAVAQPYGIIFHADSLKVVRAPPDNWEAYACTLAYYAYRADLKPGTTGSVERCLERTTTRFPNYATAWALLSLTYLDEIRFHYDVEGGSSRPLDRALEAAQRAVVLDPENVRGLQAYMTALFFSGDVDAALEVGTRAIEINPNDTELLAEYGLRLSLSGEWERGKQFLLDVLDRNPGPLGYYESVVALCYYMQRDYQTAAIWIGKANLKANPIFHIIAAAIYGQLGSQKEAGLERDWLRKNAPDFLIELPEVIRMRNISTRDQAHILDGLSKAGIRPAHM